MLKSTYVAHIEHNAQILKNRTELDQSILWIRAANEKNIVQPLSDPGEIYVAINPIKKTAILQIVLICDIRMLVY